MPPASVRRVVSEASTSRAADGAGLTSTDEARRQFNAPVQPRHLPPLASRRRGAEDAAPEPMAPPGSSRRGELRSTRCPLAAASPPRPGTRIQAADRSQLGHRRAGPDRHGWRTARPHIRRDHTQSASTASAPAQPSRVSGISARNISAALTRLLTSSALPSPSFVKIELMCFSTACLVRTSASATAVLLLP